MKTSFINVVLSLFCWAIGFTANAQVQSQPVPELVYTLPPAETISYYTRVAPDLTAIGFTKTKLGHFKVAPVLLNLIDRQITPLVNVSYDPTFSPDYNLATKKGFVFGTRGGGSIHAKHMLFYSPGEFQKAKGQFYFSNISGYATIAHLQDETLLPESLRPHIGTYMVMGKRWRWFAIEPILNSNGDIVEYRRTHPARGDLAAEPLCTNLSLNFEKADSMISPKGQYISAKRLDRDRVPVIIRTKDCTVVDTPALNGIYGGKATFSNDERYMVFHGFGVDGRTHVVDQMTHEGLIKKWADQGVVSNVFIYDIQTDQLIRLTNNDSQNSAVNFFPNFSGDGAWIYFHQHKKGASSTEIYRVLNPWTGPSASSPPSE